MVNQIFANLSVPERKVKLRTALRNKTQNALTESELQTIMENVDLGRQYVICPCSDISGFFQKLPRSGTLAASDWQREDAAYQLAAASLCLHSDRGRDHRCSGYESGEIRALYSASQ